MGRPVVLSNGSMFVGLNEHGMVHDFYYPYVGLDNLTTARSVHHKVGIWVDGEFSWVDQDGWQRNIDFEADALVSDIRLTNITLGISIRFQDFVDSEHNAFCRSVTVQNLKDTQRDVRLFMHQVFQISSDGRADTALYVPDASYLLDYKGRCCLVVYGQTSDGQPFDQYAIGNYGIEGKEGTFKDAEDGELSGNPVEHAGVDSVMRFRMVLEPNQEEHIDYWIAAASSQFDAEKIHNALKHRGLDLRLIQTRKYWHTWLATGADALHGLDKKYLSTTKKSLLIVKAHIDRRGSVLASGDSSIFNYGRDYYCYCWPRDGAYAMWPLIRLGFSEEPKRFFEFCRDVLHPDGYMGHKYQPDRAIGSTWHPLVHGQRRELAIQEDETAIVLYMLGEFYDYSKDEDFVRGLYANLIQPCANFMASYFDEQTGLPHASYDLWEEKFASHSYSVALVQAALRVASKFATMFDYADDALRWEMMAEKINRGYDAFKEPTRGYARKSFLLDSSNGALHFDDTLDVSSAYGILMFADVTPSNKQLLTDTIAAIETDLLNVSPSGGAPRYTNDWYMRTTRDYTGNPWYVCTLWVAQYYIRHGDIEKAKVLIDWTVERAYTSGVLSEQVDPRDSRPLGVAPLVWSHAELINTVLDLQN